MLHTDAKPDIDPVAAVEPSPITGGGLYKRLRQLIVFILGMSVLIVGIAMIVLPGPATVVIPAGLAILATEFAWAARWLAYLTKRAKEVAEWTGAGNRCESRSNTGSGRGRETHQDSSGR